jgi:hypothetical protein
MRHRNEKKGTELVWSCDYTDFVKRFIIHRFDSLAKVVVSPVFQTSVDVFRDVLDRTSCLPLAVSFHSVTVRPMTWRRHVLTSPGRTDFP